MTNYTFTCQCEHGSAKVAQVSIAHMQGLERNLKYYSNTAVQCARIQSHRPLNLGTNPTDGKTSGRKVRQRRRRHKPGSSDDATASTLKSMEEGDPMQLVVPEEHAHSSPIGPDSSRVPDATFEGVSPSASVRRPAEMRICAQPQKEREEQKNRLQVSNAHSATNIQQSMDSIRGASSDMWRRPAGEYSAPRGVDAYSRAGSSEVWFNMSKGSSGVGTPVLTSIPGEATGD